MALPPPDPRLPVVLVSGWLGAGKTTLLNHILDDPGGRRYAVLVNEFGEVAVDHRLVVRAEEDLVELANGCVCCTVRGDLVAALERLRRRRGLLRRRRRFDAVLLETTGLAEPAPLLRTFLVEESIATGWRVASVVAVADARHATSALGERTAREQVAVADHLLLNKCDLVDEASVEELDARLRRLNPLATLHRTVRAQLSPAAILTAPRPCRLQDLPPPEAAGAHLEDIVAVSLREKRPLDELQAQLWLRACVRLLGPRLLRYKGFLNLADHPYRVLLQGVYDLFSAEADAPWGDETPCTELVFIGRGLDEAFLRRGLEACVAGGAEIS